MRNLWKIIFLGGIVFLSSCYEDNLSRWADSDLELIKEAQNYFEETITEAVIQGTFVKEGSYSPGEVVPEWKEAYIKRDADIEYVFVPLFTQKMYFARFKRYKKSGEYFVKVQVSQILCIRKNLEGELSAAYLTLIPTYEYHNKNKQKTVTQFIKSPDFYSNFTGGVLYNDIVSFRLFAVDKVEKGKTDWGFSRANTPNNKKFNELCSIIFENVYVYGGIYTRGGGDDTVPGYELEEVVVIWCTKCQQQVEEGHDCPGKWWGDEDDDNKNPGGENPDVPDPLNPNPGNPNPGGSIGGGGGGSGTKPGTGNEDGNNNEENKKTPKLDPLYSDLSTLTQAQKELLNGALNTLLNNVPKFNDIYRTLLNKNIKIAFKINPNLKSNAQFNATNNSISFLSQSAINDYNLSEELVHAVQCNEFYLTNRTSFETNIEFEAKVYLDILNQNGPGGSFKASMFIPNEVIFAQYKEWIMDYVDYRDYNAFMREYHKFLSEFEYLDEYGNKAGYIPGKEPEFLKKYIIK